MKLKSRNQGCISKYTYIQKRNRFFCPCNSHPTNYPINHKLLFHFYSTESVMQPWLASLTVLYTS